jgi:hypothetical protein
VQDCASQSNGNEKIETEPGLPFSDVELGYGMLDLVIKEKGRPLSRVHVAKV